MHSLYQGALILTYEDDIWRFSAKSAQSGDVVHRYEGATLSEGHQTSPAGLAFPPAGQRRAGSTMDHIARAIAPCQRAGRSILIGQDQRTLVLHRGPDLPRRS